MIINSNKRRALADSKYNERFAQCREALSLLQQQLDVKNLCDIGTATFEKYSHLLHDPMLLKRATHVVTENERVKQAQQALLSGELKEFGQLMFGSHQSLKELYEVSGKELDTIVDFSAGYRGCTGARMTGAGFGGCAIALVKKEQFEDYSAQLINYYNEKIGYKPGVFASVISDGVRAW